MRAPNRKSGGYSLIELLTVMAIIGVLSLITVPSFISFQRAGKMKSSLRNFTMDLRGMRQRAITQNIYTKVVIAPAATETTASRTYTFWQSADSGVTWTPLPMRGGFGGATTTVIGQGTGNAKQLDKAVFFSAMSGYRNNELVFRPNGAAGSMDTAPTPPQFVLVPFAPPSDPPANTIVLRTLWNVRNNQITVTLTPTGQIRTVQTHV
jgi:prepilin-type N-terminal cleavage/methylation domain-containing protein